MGREAGLGAGGGLGEGGSGGDGIWVGVWRGFRGGSGGRQRVWGWGVGALSHALGIAKNIFVNRAGGLITRSG